MGRVVGSLIALVFIAGGVYDLRTGRITAARNRPFTSSSNWFYRIEGRFRAVVVIIGGSLLLIAMLR